MQIIANVHIVISSDWRRGWSVDQLKEIFDLYSFSHLIIDKTTEDDSQPYEEWKSHCVIKHFDLGDYLLRCRTLLNPHTYNQINDPIKSEFDFLFKKCKASEIKKYLEDNPLFKKHFLAFDDVDSHQTRNLGNHFISTKDTGRLTKAHCHQAYEIFMQCMDLISDQSGEMSFST